jgi:hypothetical protein
MMPSNDATSSQTAGICPAYVTPVAIRTRITWAPMTHNADDALRYIYIGCHVGLTMFDRDDLEGSQTEKDR